MRRLLAALAAALTTALALPAALAAAEPPASVAPAIAKTRAALDGAALTEAQRASAVKALDAAAELDEAADALVSQTAQVRSDAAAAAPSAAPASPSAADRQRQLQQWIARLPAKIDVTTLERLLASEHAIVADTRHALDEAAQQLTTLISRPATAPATVVALRQRADAAAPAAAEDEPATLTQARLLQHGADQRQALADLALREAQQTTAQARQQRLEQQILMLRQQLDEHQPRISWLEQRIATEGEAALTAQAESLAAEAATLSTGAEHDLAQTNADLAAELLTQSTALSAEREELATHEYTRELMTNALRDTQARLRVGGRSDAIGQWLWQQRLATPSLSSLRLQRKDVQARLGRLRLALFNNTKARDLLAQGQDDQAHSPSFMLMGTSPAPTEASSAAGSASPDSEAMNNQRATQADLYNQLDPLLRRRIDVLERTDAALQTIADAGGQLQDLMTRQLLWTPSHTPIDAGWFGRWAQTVKGEFESARGWRLVGHDLRTHAVAWLVSLLAVLLAVLLRRHGIRRLRELAEAVADPARDRFRLTLAALGWSLVIAAPAALAVSLVGVLVHELGVNQHRGLETLGLALQQVGDAVYYLGLTLALLRPFGLAASHLRWQPRRLQVLYQGWRVIRWLAIPAAFTVLVALQSENAAAIDTWARAAVVVYGLGMATIIFWMAARLLPPRTPGQPRTLARRLPLLLLPAAFASTALMALAGYLYSGVLVLDALQKCLAVLLAVAVVDGLLRRWLLLGEQRLAQRNRAQAQAADTGRAEGATDEDDGPLTLVAISAQSRRLLRLLRLALVLVGLFWAGADVLPALARFEDIQLWSSDGTAVTLMNVLAAGLLLALVASLARNLPGLVELMLTPYPQISAASRYTATTLARYVIVIGGVVMAFGALGLRWGQLQWMAAALTVGLGFGLQEIFANFVSGLILLVERPFRVGDTITIGDLTGTVTRIHTRATTVLDYDNKEIVIPNKTFITGQVTNWTLSDNVTRLTLNVGAAYGSPPERVRELLLQAAREHPLVLREPPPNCWFMDLGASTLDFELRLYAGALGDRLVVRHQVLTRITELFAQAGIEIAFPQMDVHVRDWPTLDAAPAGGLARP